MLTLVHDEEENNQCAYFRSEAGRNSDDGGVKQL